MLLVPAPMENRNAVSGAIRVICFGRFSMTLAATATIQSTPPAACIMAAEVTTARMIAQGGRRRLAGRLAEDEDEDERAEAAPQADPDAAGPGAHDDGPEHHQRLEYEAHVHARCLLSCGSRPSVLTSASHCTATRCCSDGPGLGDVLQ